MRVCLSIEVYKPLIVYNISSLYMCDSNVFTVTETCRNVMLLKFVNVCSSSKLAWKWTDARLLRTSTSDSDIPRHYSY